MQPTQVVPRPLLSSRASSLANALGRRYFCTRFWSASACTEDGGEGEVPLLAPHGQPYMYLLSREATQDCYTLFNYARAEVCVKLQEMPSK